MTLQISFKLGVWIISVVLLWWCQCRWAMVCVCVWLVEGGCGVLLQIRPITVRQLVEERRAG